MKNGLHIDENGVKRWYKDGKLHREDGPAVVWSDGTKKWYIDNKLHREDGPATMYKSGNVYFCLNNIKVKLDLSISYRKLLYCV